MSNDNMPVASTNDMAIQALTKHWRARDIGHIHIAAAGDSAMFAGQAFAGAVITSHPPLPDSKDLALMQPKADQVSGAIFIPDKFIFPAPPISVVSAWQSLASQIATGSRRLDDLHWKEFEDLMGEILETSGWSITPMGYTKDGGIDIIAVRNLQPGVPIEMLVQCKRFKQSRRVGVEIVKEVWATKFENAFHQAMIAATSSFTRGARDKAKIWKMDLRDYDAIFEWCKQVTER